MPYRAQSDHYFPCPVCAARLEVRITKKQKPYLVCDPCGVQLFVRSRSGIEKFSALVDRAESGHALDRLAEMERRYRKKCSECGKWFWTAPELLEIDLLYEPTGFKCPEDDCDGFVKLENAE